MKRICVTGGCGFLGSALVRSLVAAGHRVRALDNMLRGYPRRLIGVDVGIVPGDIRVLEEVLTATRGMDCVVHLAGVNGTRHFYERPYEVMEIATQGMLNIIRACEMHKVKELLVASSSEVYQTPPVIPTPEDVPLSIPDPHNPRYSYAAGKILTEMLALHSTCFDRVVVFRPHNVFGPDAGFDHVIPEFICRLLKIADGVGTYDFPIQGSGIETRSFCYIEDAVSGIMTLLEKGRHREIYNIGTVDQRSVRELLAVMAGEIPIRGKINIVPDQLRHGSTRDRRPDVSKLRNLGWRPQVNLCDGLKKTIDWYKEHPCPA